MVVKDSGIENANERSFKPWGPLEKSIQRLTERVPMDPPSSVVQRKSWRWASPALASSL